MLFNSISYLLFFPVIFAVYWLSPAGKPRQVVLLLGSYFFYMSWLPQYGLLLLALTVINYLLGLAISRSGSEQLSRLAFMVGIFVNLGALCYYKYADFLLQSLAGTLNFVNLNIGMPFATASFPALHIILPLAISFFAFEFIHYLYDVRKGDEPIESPLEFALFASFFPSAIAGPIKRYQDFLVKIRKNPEFQAVTFNDGLSLLLQGLFKKVALADNLAIIANQGFQHSSNLGAVETWIAVLAFTFQIYFDFSGYTDMGRGSALMLGIELPRNFNLPYLATSVSDFWKRWHISLSTWLRDYLYIPLGGNRCDGMRRQFNLMITMLLGGLWHGAAWHYVAWGAIHGLGLVIYHGYSELAGRSKILTGFHNKSLAKYLSIAVTFAFVVVTWVFFRAESVPQALSILSTMFAGGHSSVLEDVIRSSVLPYALTIYVLYALSFAPAVVSLPKGLQSIRDRVFARTAVKIPCYAGAYVAAIALSSPQLSAFIYFQF